MAQGRPSHVDSKLTVRYAGDKLDAREVDGKIWFAVDGKAVLTRELQGIWDTHGAFKPAPDTTANVTASIHVVIGGSSPTVDDRSDPAAEGEVSLAAAGDAGDAAATAAAGAAVSVEDQSAFLLKTAQQASTAFAAATALPPGIHIMCYLPPPSRLRDDTAGVADGKAEEVVSDTDTSVVGQWAALWRDVRAGTRPGEEAELLTWQTPCQRLLHDASAYLESEAARSLAVGILDAGTPTKGWALVPCERSEGLVCELARGERAGDGDGGGMVAWLHHAMDSTEAAAASAVALADSLLLTSDAKPEPTYASVSALNLGAGSVGVVAGAHRVIPRGVLSGYDLTLTPPDAQQNPKDGPKGDKNENKEPRVDRALFVDDSTAPANVGQSWRGAIKTEELPGGGLHRHVRVTVDASCAGNACGGFSVEGSAQTSSDPEWCEFLLTQHVPQGAYIDVDEVKARHEFDVRPSLPASRKVGVETFEGEPIDVELPSSVSGQHVVNFSFWVDMSKRNRGREGTASIRAEMTLPVHLRYPDPACERRGEDCEGYAWVEVPPPLASIRCGNAGNAGDFSPVLPFIPPVGAALRVPRGTIWHRDFVMWGTVAAAALGCLYTVHTLLSVMSMGAARDPDRKRR